MNPSQDEQQGSTDDDDQAQRVVVVTRNGIGVAEAPGDNEEVTNPADLVEQPAKVVRIGSMIKHLLDEVRSAPLDEAGRTGGNHRRLLKHGNGGMHRHRSGIGRAG